MKKVAELIAKNFIDNGIEEGKKPATLAGVSFFMAIRKSKSRSNDTEPVWRSIADVVKISVQTMKDCYQNALAEEDKLLPEYLKSKR